MSQFQEGQIVWAKIKGFPWWPAIVANIKDIQGNDNEKEIMVNFIGDNTHAILPENKVIDYVSHPNQNKSKKHKKLAQSIKIATQIALGQLTYEEHLRTQKKPRTRQSTPKKAENSVLSANEVNNSFKENTRTRSRKTSIQNQSLSNSECEYFDEYLPPNSKQKGKSKAQNEPIIINKALNENKEKSNSLRNVKNQNEKLKQLLEDNEEIDNEENDDSFSILNTKSSLGSDKKGSVKSAKKLKDESNNNSLLGKRYQALNKNPIYGNIDDRDKNSLNTSSEFILKKQKISSGIKNKLRFNPTDEKNMDFHKSQIAKFEEDLRNLLEHLSLRCQKLDHFSELDPDIKNLYNLMADFERYSFNGPDLINSKIGKLFKTIHYLLAQNKSRISSKAGDFLISVLAKIMHKVKEKILRFCLDESDYLNALNICLPATSNDALTKSINTIKIEDFEIRPQQKVNPSQFQDIKSVCKQQLISSQKQICFHQHSTQSAANTTITEESFTKVSQPLLSPNATNKRQEISIKSQKESCITDDLLSKTKFEDETNNKSQFNKIKYEVQHTSEKKLQPPFGMIEAKKQNSTNEKHDIGVIDQTAENTHQQFKRKFCQKFSQLLQNLYLYDKELSQDMTLIIEDRIKSFYSEKDKNFYANYRQATRAIYKIIKGKAVSKSELETFPYLTLDDFKKLYSSRVKILKSMCEISSKPKDIHLSQGKNENSVLNMSIITNKKTEISPIDHIYADKVKDLNNSINEIDEATFQNEVKQMPQKE